MAQSEEDKKRFESLGAKNLLVCGSVKFDIKPNLSQVVAARDWKARLTRPVALIASTRVGEEARFAKALKQNPDIRHRMLTIIVPRHPERFDSVYQLLVNEGFKVCRRSQLRDASDIPEDCDIVLGDSMGEMSFYCAISDMVAMGGSFEPFGCQNVIEPALAGSPVVVGPSIFNFDKIVRDGRAAGAMVQVQTPDEALTCFGEWLEKPMERVMAAEAALAFAKEYAGATDRMMKVLEEIWNKAQKNTKSML